MFFKSQKTKYITAVIFGIIAFIAGLFLILIYIAKALVDRIGQPDQSLLFWYLPFLFIGIAGIKLGLGFFIWGIISLRRKEELF